MHSRMLPFEHSAILLTCIKLPFVIKIFVLSIFEWPFYRDFTIFRKIISGIRTVSNSFDSDQARHIVKPDLGPNCLQKLSGEDTRR